MGLAYLTLDVSSSCIQMAALGHMLTPFSYSPVPWLRPRWSPSVWGLVWWHPPSGCPVLFCWKAISGPLNYLQLRITLVYYISLKKVF